MTSLAATLRRESGAEVDYLRTRVEHLETENRELKAALAAARADAAAANARLNSTSQGNLRGGLARPGSSRSMRSAGSRPSPRPPLRAGAAVGDEDRPSPIHVGKRPEEGKVGGYRPSTASTDGSDVGDTTEAPCNNCGAAVPVRNMQNHVLHCYRNVFKCPMCSVAVLVKKRQQHVEQEKGTIAALEAACKMDKLGILSNMLAHGADANCEVNEAGDTPLHVAARAGQLLVIQFLLSKGAEIDKPNAGGETPLHVACANKKFFEVSAYLLSQGASTATTTLMGDTPLDVAQRHQNTEIAILITRHSQGSSHAHAGTLRPRSSHRSRPSNRPQGPPPNNGGPRRPSLRGRRSVSGVGHTLRSVSPILS